MAATFTPYTTSKEVKEVVQKFETCDFGPGDFHHSHHLTVAMCYLLESTEAEASARMRKGLLTFLKKHASPDAYHETITLFWIKRVRQLLDRADRSRSLVELANSIIAECSKARFIDLHFSTELLASAEARRNWVEPDLKPLDSYSSGN